MLKKLKNPIIRHPETNELLLSPVQISERLKLKVQTTKIYLMKLHKLIDYYKSGLSVLYPESIVSTLQKNYGLYKFWKKIDYDNDTRIYTINKHIDEIDIRKFKKLETLTVHQNTLIICREDQLFLLKRHKKYLTQG